MIITARQLMQKLGKLPPNTEIVFASNDETTEYSHIIDATRNQELAIIRLVRVSYDKQNPKSKIGAELK